jgi:hypothetical protein
VKIDFAGRMWDLDTDELTLAQGVVITGRMGGSLADWDAALEDPRSPGWLTGIQCLYWLMLQQDGQRVAIGDVDFKVLQFSQAVADAVKREEDAAGAGAEPDPTQPAAGPEVSSPPTASSTVTGSPANPT